MGEALLALAGVTAVAALAGAVTHSVLARRDERVWRATQRRRTDLLWAQIEDCLDSAERTRDGG